MYRKVLHILQVLFHISGSTKVIQIGVINQANITELENLQNNLSAKFDINALSCVLIILAALIISVLIWFKVKKYFKTI